MVGNFALAVGMATALGFLSGLGTGGGSLLILWLGLGLDMAQQQARLINLMFFIPAALVACLFRWKQGQLDIKKVLPAVIAGSISAVIFSLIGKQMDTSLLEKFFGGLLIVTGVRELLYKPRQK